MTMPVSSASSPELAAGSIATTILARFGAAVCRAASMDAVAPQRARGVLEQFGIELLPAEARPFVFADDLVEEPGCQIGAIFVDSLCWLSIVDFLEGEGGILAVAAPEFRPVYEYSKRRLTWPDDAMATTFSAEEAGKPTPATRRLA